MILVRDLGSLLSFGRPVVWVSSVNRLFPSILAVLALILVPQIASASCGDWLQHPQPTAAAGQAPAAQPGAFPDALGDFAPSPLGTPPCGCQGPACQQAPAGPASPAAPDSLVKSDPQLAWLLSGRGAPKPGGARRGAEGRISLAEGFAVGIYRPPRR